MGAGKYIDPEHKTLSLCEQTLIYPVSGNICFANNGSTCVVNQLHQPTCPESNQLALKLYKFDIYMDGWDTTSYRIKHGTRLMYEGTLQIGGYEADNLCLEIGTRLFETTVFYSYTYNNIVLYTYTIVYVFII